MVLNIAALQKDMERTNTEDQGSNSLADKYVMMPEKNGVVIVRILGPAPLSLFDHEDLLYQTTRVHRVNDRSWHCPRELTPIQTRRGMRELWVGDCVICDHYHWLWEESKKDDCPADKAKKMQAEARLIKPVERYYYNVLVRKEHDPNTNEIRENVGPKILSVGVKLHRMILRAILGDAELEEKPLGDITDPTNGRDFKIIKQMVRGGDGNMYANYDTSKFIEPSPLGDPGQVEEWMKNLHDLRALRDIAPKDELVLQMQKYLGVVQEEDNQGYHPSQLGYDGNQSSVTVTSEEPTSESTVTAEATTSPATETTPEPKTEEVAEEPSEESAPLHPENDFIAGLQAVGTEG